ncbi:MAG TPA: SIMPL domain-containing protein [Clostridiales bacterium]|nr:MAG: hypothetical protein A2Y18_04235 [Clostridiales bacterium GWD2_32_19]HCC07302.1 SIMPL domain-containing protein [Clostridiales bacterium]
MNTNLKKAIAGSLALVMLVGTVAFGGFNPDIAKADDAAAALNRKTITVSGEAKVKVAPDIAYVNVGVRTEGKTAVAAQQANAQKMTAVIDAIKKAGIDAKDLKTSNYYVNQMYTYENNTSKVTGYEATNTITVKVRDITKTGDIIDIASKMGSNITNGVTFGLVDETASYNEALSIAMKNAQGKANALATVVGVQLDKPSRISEDSYGGGAQPMYSNQAMNMKAYDSVESATPVESGDIEITARVSVEYQY